MQKAMALIQLHRYDEAAKSLEQTIKTQTDKELLSEAEFALATVYREMEKYDLAMKTFRTVRDKYAGTEQAEQASFWVGEIAATSGDAKTALTELNAFIAKYPKSTLLANALYFKARAQAQTGDHAGGLATYTELIQKFPQTEPAQPAMFELAGMLQHDADDEAQKAKPEAKPNYEKVHAVMVDFVKKYPKSDRLYAAYDFSAQLYVKEEKLDGSTRKRRNSMMRRRLMRSISLRTATMQTWGKRIWRWLIF
jgi:TolA-binding protein